MTWAKVDDTLHADPRAERAGLEAMGLYTLALSYMGAYHTDGIISRDRVRRLGGRQGQWLAKRLVAAGFWENLGDDGYRLANWQASLIQSSRKPQEFPGENLPPNLGQTYPQTSGERTPKPHPKPPQLSTQVSENDGPRERRGETPRAPARPDPDPTRPDPEIPEHDPGSPRSPGQRVLFEPSEGTSDGGAKTGAKRPPKLTEVPAEDLTPAERRIADAITGDESFRLTVPMPNRLARELLRIAPDVDIPRKIAALGAWTREKPANWRPRGHVFLRTCVEKAQAEAPPRPPQKPDDEEPEPTPWRAPRPPPPVFKPHVPDAEELELRAIQARAEERYRAAREAKAAHG